MFDDFVFSSSPLESFFLTFGAIFLCSEAVGFVERRWSSLEWFKGACVTRVSRLGSEGGGSNESSCSSRQSWHTR